MCGIAGAFDAKRERSAQELGEIVERLTNAIAHRGPDDFGYHRDPEVGLALGHRRLSIIDTSPAGHQPRASSDGRFIMVYNGEVYNFRDLAKDLATRGVHLRSGSDTEVCRCRPRPAQRCDRVHVTTRDRLSLGT